MHRTHLFFFKSPAKHLLKCLRSDMLQTKQHYVLYATDIKKSFFKQVGNAEKQANRKNVGKAFFIKCLHIGCLMGPI